MVFFRSGGLFWQSTILPYSAAFCVRHGLSSITDKLRRCFSAGIARVFSDLGKIFQNLFATAVRIFWLEKQSASGP